MILYNTSSTGTSSAYAFGSPVSKVSIQPSGACTVVLQGSINGSDWADVIASSTYAAGTLKTSTGNFLVSRVRATFTAIGTTSFTFSVIGA